MSYGGRTILLFVYLTWFADVAWAQIRHNQEAVNQATTEFIAERLVVNGAGVGDGPRSVPLALGLSAVVPGAGQVYNKSWLKAGVMAAVEGGVIGAHLIWKKNGQDAERDFQVRAHAEWNPARYAEWINDYTDFLIAEHAASVSSPAVTIPGGVDWMNPGAWTAGDEATVRQMFNEIRALERELFHPETGAAFSHRLPYFAEQQYYELIGKYFQFAPGWSDYPAWSDATGFTGAIDPQTSDADGNRIYVSPKFYSYADDHAHANDLLRRSSRILGVLLFNHLFSAIDAAIFAKLHNNRLSTSMHLSSELSLSPGATLQFRF